MASRRAIINIPATKRQSKILGLLNGVLDLFDQHSGSILPRHELSLCSR